MPNLNPLVTGDVPYPQYSVTTTQEILTGTVIIKGRIYTKDPAGLLIPHAANLNKGIYQARATPPDGAALLGDKVQVLGPRTRMLLVDVNGGLVEGDLVDTLADSDQVVVTATTDDPDFIGRVFEIYTKDAQGTKKKVAAAGDLVVVETVGP